MSATVTEPIQITSQPGALLDFNLCRFPSALAPGSLELWTMLAAATGRARRGGGEGGFELNDTVEAGWRKPRDLSAGLLQGIVDRVVLRQGRAGVMFALDAPSDLPVHDRVDLHFARAQRRKEREG